MSWYVQTKCYEKLSNYTEYKSEDIEIQFKSIYIICKEMKEFINEIRVLSGKDLFQA